MKIGFDAKRAFHNNTGLGNYSRSIIQSVADIRHNDQLYLITPSSNLNNFKTYNNNINIIKPPLLSNKQYWRFKGVNKQLKKIGLDIYHGLSNEIPYNITCKSVVTIHDLLFLKYPNFYNYIDQKVYYFKSKIACQQADAIIATSEQTRKDIINFFNIRAEKIHVIYQTCQSEFMHYKTTPETNSIREPYILYVGSIEERKNLIFLLQADAIIATSEQTKKDIINFFNIRADKIHVIYQTCQSEFMHYKTTPETNSIREPYILYVGSIEERKNLIFLLQALKKMNREIKLFCVGRKCTYYKKVKKFIHQHNLNERVHFLNIKNTNLLAQLYRKSRALIYPSIDEGFGIPIIEGMYSKIPVITSNKAIFKEIGGEDSYYFEEGNIDSLIEQISETWTDSQKRKTKIEKNFQYVQKFNKNQQVKKIIKIYESLI